MEISGLSAHFDCEGLAQAASEFPRAKTALSSGPDGEQRLIDLATLPEADMVLIAIVGTAGLKPALAAIEAGKDLAVASKEILVMAGEIVMAAAARKGVNVLPVDSEHNAIFQCLDGRAGTAPQRIILTCSGGPFRATPRAELDRVTPEMALKHPTWSMGRKISIDSATLFNKGLEMIEARWLFDVPMEKVDVVDPPAKHRAFHGGIRRRLAARPTQPLGHVLSHTVCRYVAGACLEQPASAGSSSAWAA